VKSTAKRPVSVAYATAGNLYERLRSRGESAEAAMASAVKLVRSFEKSEAMPATRYAVPSWARQLIEVIAWDNGVDPAKLYADGSCTSTVTQIRSEAVYIVRAVGKGTPSLNELAAHFGRDHSSLSKAHREFAERLKTEDLTRARVDKYLADRGHAKKEEAA
jgi:chromosomal replication initiation ATPase DnaA